MDIPGEGTGRVRKQSKSSTKKRSRSRSKSREKRASQSMEEGGSPAIPEEPTSASSGGESDAAAPTGEVMTYSGGDMEVKTSNPEAVESAFLLHDAGHTRDFPSDVLFDYVLVMPNQDEDAVKKASEGCCSSENKTKNRIDRRNKIMAKLEKAGFFMRKAYNADESQMIVELGAKISDLEKWAEEMELSVQLRAEHGGRYTEFTAAQRHMFRPSMNPDTVFTSSERQQIVYKTLVQPEPLGGCNMNIGKLISKGIIVSAFPLHNHAEREALREKWLKGWRQPLNDVKDYYGESIAFYFAWLGFYTKWLWAPALIGIAANLTLIWEGSLYSPDLSKAPERWVPYILSSYSVFMMLWATAFTEFWKRKQSKLAYRWDVLEFQPTDHHRPEFYGEIRPSPVTGRPELFYPRWKYLLKMAIGAFIVGILVLVSISVMFALVASRARIQAAAAAEADDPATAAASNQEQILFSFYYSLVLVISELVFTKIAALLTDWENHATHHDYENNLILKTFFFQLINSFIALYFYAFFTGNDSLSCKIQRDIDETGVSDDCDPTATVNVVRNLSLQLATTMLTRTVVGNAKEYVQPLLTRLFFAWSAGGKKKKGSEETHELSEAEKQAALPPYLDTFQDYAELVLQYGFVTFFSAAFPAGPLIALINNVYEIRGDASKLLDQHQRPQSVTSPNIGTWLSVLEGMSVLAIMTNALLLAFSQDTVTQFINTILGNENLNDEVSPSLLFIAAVLIEHVVIFLKFLLTVLIPDMSNALKIQIAKEEYEKAQLLGLKSKYDTNDNEADEEDLEVREGLLPGLF